MVKGKDKLRYIVPWSEIIHSESTHLCAGTSIKGIQIHDAASGTTESGKDAGLVDGNQPGQANDDEKPDAKKWTGYQAWGEW